MKSFILITLISSISAVPSWAVAQIKWTKAQMDSVHKVLASLPDSANVDVKTLRLAITFMYLKTLRDGHSEYVSLPSLAPKGEMSRTKAEVATVSAKVAKLDSLERNMAALGELILKLSALNEQTGNTILENVARTEDLEKVVSIKGAIDPDDGNHDQKAAYERLIYRAKKSMSSAQK